MIEMISAALVAILAIAAALLARSIWLLVGGELADSWRWILPGFAVYAISGAFRAAGVFLPEAFQEAAKLLQESLETLFLILVVVGLIRQHRLFMNLSGKEEE